MEPDQSRQFFAKPFEIDPDIYDARIGRALAGCATRLVATHDQFPIVVLEYENVIASYEARTFVTSGLGLFPLHDADLNGYVSREFAVSISSGAPLENLLAFIKNVTDAILDAKETPSIGSCFAWSAALRHLDLKNVNHIFVGHAFLDPEIRTFNVEGLPETHVLELIPLTDAEVDDLENGSSGIPEYFHDRKLNPTCLRR